MTRLFVVSSFRYVLLSLIVCSLFLCGCGGKKKAKTGKDYGKPIWQKVDSSKFAKLSEYETTLEGGKIIVYDPEGWERTSPGRAPKGFKSVIRFTNGRTTILLTKSKDVREMPDLDESNIEDLAVGFQEKFKTPVKMIKLGNIVGVYFAKAAKDAERLSKPLERRIVATSIGGELYTYELVTDKGGSKSEYLNALYAVIAKTKIEGMESDEAEDETTTQVVADQPETKPAEPAPVEVTAPVEVATKTEKTKPVEVAATTPAAPKEEPTPAAKPETKPIAEPVTEVATVAPAKPVEEKKPAASTKKPAAKKPAKKGSTKDILNELDALLN